MMELPSAQELLDQLNTLDETVRIEAKEPGHKIDRSVMETVNSFSNEPGLGGGAILIGARKEERADGTVVYTVCGVTDPDKLNTELATRSANDFNVRVRPVIEQVELHGETVLVVHVPELPIASKPLYFKDDGWPSGAYRRIGSTDQRCTDDDLAALTQATEGFDATIVPDSTWADVDPAAVEHYRRLRSKVRADAAELGYSDEDLLHALGCCKMVGGQRRLTMAGLLLFGSEAAQRRMLPMVRLDYVLVPGREWVADPDERFTTIDMRGPLLRVVERAINAVAGDLPKGFGLAEGEVQAHSRTLPTRALREAIVNAVMHRSYRVQQPVQVIRYSNRLEILNPGFSLKNADSLGEPGSVPRNPLLAAVFHDTDLAETKGSGIRTMRRLMEQAEFAPPTFESDRERNQFTARLLLHHFMREEDLRWLERFADLELTDDQRKSLVFLKEAGALDNASHRQLNGLDISLASRELRLMRDAQLLVQKGAGRSTYYLPGPRFAQALQGLGPNSTTSAANSTSLAANDTSLAANGKGLAANETSEAANDTTQETEQHDLLLELPERIIHVLNALGGRTGADRMRHAILVLCAWRELTLGQLATLLLREPPYIRRHYLAGLMADRLLEFTVPQVKNHPRQAYRTTAAGLSSLEA